MTPARSKHSAPASSLGNQPSFFEKSVLHAENAAYNQRVKMAGMDNKLQVWQLDMSMEIPVNRAASVGFQDVPRSFKDEFCVEPKHTNQLLGNIT